MKVMRRLHIVGQNLKGRAQEVKGEIEIASGNKVKGTIDKIRGKANIVIADIKNKVETSK
jgi:uncharacterized protein YjbJ (UPF0337 family)